MGRQQHYSQADVVIHLPGSSVIKLLTSTMENDWQTQTTASCYEMQKNTRKKSTDQLILPRTQPDRHFSQYCFNVQRQHTLSSSAATFLKLCTEILLGKCFILRRT